MKPEQIENNFSYHPPTPRQAQNYIIIRNNAKTLAYKINDFCPEGREKALAMTKLEEAVMWANAAIARDNKTESSEQ